VGETIQNTTYLVYPILEHPVMYNQYPKGGNHI